MNFHYKEADLPNIEITTRIDNCTQHIYREIKINNIFCDEDAPENWLEIVLEHKLCDATPLNRLINDDITNYEEAIRDLLYYIVEELINLKYKGILNYIDGKWIVNKGYVLSKIIGCGNE